MANIIILPRRRKRDFSSPLVDVYGDKNDYLDDRPFYVFDEWAAEQDPLFKQIFYTQILHELRSPNKAVLVISHDDRYYHVADRIIKMEFGRCLGS